MCAGFTSLFCARHIDNSEDFFSSFDCDRHLWWTGFVHTGLVENSEERNHLEDIGVDGKIILKLIFKKWDL